MYEVPKKFAWSSLKSGIVITLALLILFLTILFAGNLGKLFAQKNTIFARFSNIEGLRSGAPVWLHGIEVGTVKNIQLTESGTIISLSLTKRTFDHLQDSAHASVRTMGLLGDKFIEIYPGPSTIGTMDPGDTIPGRKPTELEKIVESGTESLASVDTLIRHIDEFVMELKKSQGTLNQLVENPDLYNQLSAAAQSINAATRELRQAEGSMNQLLHDPSLYKNMNDAAELLSSLLTQIDNGNGIAGALVNNEKLVTDIERTVANVNALIDDMRKDPGKYFKFELF